MSANGRSIAPISSLQMVRPKGFLNTSDDNNTISMTTLPKPRYEAILSAAAPSNYDQRAYSASVTLPSYVPETSTSSISSIPFGFRPRTSTFGPDNDMEEILRGAREMKVLRSALAGKDRIAALEGELAGLYESYERLAEVHRKTWDGMVGMVLEDER